MQVIRPFLEKYQIKTKSIAVGVSGGADSLALVLMLKEEYPDFDIIALTVDHGLRPSSYQEAIYVSQIMKQFGIQHHILTWDGKKPSTGIEEAARKARYDLLFSWCLKHNIQYLAIAHHMYDQAETFLMRLERGSGLFGLSAMQEVSQQRGVFVLRPLLNTDPSVMKNFLKERHTDWVEDESNQCTDFLRVRLRKFLPLLAQETGITPERLVKASENLQNIRSFIEELVEKTISDKVHYWMTCGASFDFAEFMSWHNELKFYILNRLICEISGNTYAPEAESLKMIIKNLQKTDFCGATLGGIYFCKQDLSVWLIKEYRGVNIECTEKEWGDIEKQVPEVRGLKFPAKLKQALVYEKKREN